MSRPARLRGVDADGRARDLPVAVRVASSFTDRLLGLMFRRSLAADAGLWLADCRAIHMGFVFFPIDAVFVADDGRIVKIAAVRPWRWAAAPGARHTLELPAGGAARLGLAEGMVVRLVD